mmetsp:Transcript_28288/g.74212  ORF Transcript_28288/g.74212 Transcript_28288/m.74212 type:complete len:258 (+) Transcript_28288:264-1037(+)
MEGRRDICHQAGVELRPGYNPLLLFAVEVNPLMVRRLGKVCKCRQHHLGVTQVAARLLRHSIMSCKLRIAMPIRKNFRVGAVWTARWCCAGEVALPRRPFGSDTVGADVDVRRCLLPPQRQSCFDRRDVLGEDANVQRRFGHDKGDIAIGACTFVDHREVEALQHRGECVRTGLRPHAFGCGVLQNLGRPGPDSPRPRSLERVRKVTRGVVHGRPAVHDRSRLPCVEHILCDIPQERVRVCREGIDLVWEPPGSRRQ